MRGRTWEEEIQSRVEISASQKESSEVESAFLVEPDVSD